MGLHVFSISLVDQLAVSFWLLGYKLGFLLNVTLLLFPQPLTADLHYYYILELSFYWSLMVSQFTDIKRKVRVLVLHGLGLRRVKVSKASLSSG